ncbi:MAG: hypothetical protein AABY95_05690 [Pseudomonadota bacterium]
MRNRSLALVLLSSLLLVGCIDFGDDADGGGGGPSVPGGEECGLPGETCQIEEKIDGGTATTTGAPPCEGLLGTNLEPVACTEAPVVEESLNSGIKSILCDTPIEGVAELLFGDCQGALVPGAPGTPNLTVYVRLRKPTVAETVVPEATERKAVFAGTATIKDKVDRLTITRTTEGDPSTGTVPLELERARNPLGKNLIFEIVMQGPHTNDVTVGYTTADALNLVNGAITGDTAIDTALKDGTFHIAEAGKDYGPLSGSLTFPGNAATCVEGTEPSCVQILPVKPNPEDPLDPVPNIGNTNHSNSRDGGLRVTALNDFAQDSDGCDADDPERMALRITAVQHTEPDNGNPRNNNGAPQLIQKAALGSIVDDDCPPPPPDPELTFCGNTDTGKKLTILGRSVGVIGTGSFESFTTPNIKTYSAVVRDGVLTLNDVLQPATLKASPSNTPDQYGEAVDEGSADLGGLPTADLGTVFNQAFGSLNNGLLGPVFPELVGSLAVRAVSAVEALRTGVIDVDAGVAYATITAARTPVETPVSDGDNSNGIPAGNEQQVPPADPTLADIQISRVAEGARVEAGAALTGLAIGGVAIPLNTQITAPNTTIPLAIGVLVLNEQLDNDNNSSAVDQNSGPLTGDRLFSATQKGHTFIYRSVNMLHLYGPDGDLIVGHNSIGMSCQAKASNAFSFADIFGDTAVAGSLLPFP